MEKRYAYKGPSTLYCPAEFRESEQVLHWCSLQRGHEGDHWCDDKKNLGLGTSWKGINQSNKISV